MKIHYHPGNSYPYFIIVLLLIISLMAVFSIDSTGSRAQPGKVSSPAVTNTVGKTQVTIDKDYGKMPLAFIPNKGQMDRQVYFYLQGKDKNIYFTSTGLTYSLNASGGSEPFCKTVPTPLKTFANEPKVRDSSKPSKQWVVKLDFVGARKNVKPESLEKSGTVISYFKGKPEEWQTGLPAASKIIYRDLWPGIDLVYYGTVNKMKYEFIVQPGAEPAQIKLAYRGAESVMENSQGQLEVQTPVGSFFDDTPMAWQEMAGKRESVDLKYALEKKDTSNPQDSCIYGFSVGEYNKNETLILDPAVLVYCGYIGGSVEEDGNAIAVDASGCAYITGGTYTTETSFPVTVGPDLTHNGTYDAFLAKVKADGTGLVYCGYIGGDGGDFGHGIRVDESGCAYVAGYTTSTQTTFPVMVGPDLTYNGGGSDDFVAKISADGTGLVYCGYIGGSSSDYGYGNAVDTSGCAYIIGYTESAETTFPVTVGPDLTFNGGYTDVFVAKVKADGTGLAFCGYIGGSSQDYCYGRGIAVDGSGCAYITGHTQSDQTSFPVKVGPDLTYNGGDWDAFVAKVKADGTALDYCGYIGGSGYYDIGYGIAVDGSGCAYVTGETTSNQTSFPVTVGPDLTYNGDYEAFVAKVKADGSSLVYCGYIGGSNFDCGYGIAIDAAGCAYVAGNTGSTETSFPVAVGPDLIFNGYDDAFVARVKANGTGFDYCGYIGGLNADIGRGIAVDGSGGAYITGITFSTETSFPVTVGPDLTYNGGDYDAFVAKISWTNPSYTVNFTPGTGGSLTGITTQTVISGGNCTAVEAVPNTGYHFVNWTGTNGFVTTTDNPLTVTNVTADMTITANFAINTYTVTFVPDSHGTLTGVTPQVVNYGTSCTAVEAVPNTGYHFVNWTGTGGFVTTTDNPLTVSNVTADMTITANFTIDTYTVTFVPDSNGTLTGVTPQVVNYGNNCTAVEAVPNTGYHFVNWTGTNGFVTTTDNPLTVTNVTADMTITANFAFTPALPIQLGAWSTTTPFNTPRSAHTSVVYNGYLYVLGGCDINDTRYNDVQYAPINADGSLGSWQNTTPFNTGRRSHTSVAYNGYLYVIGGTPSGGGVRNDVQFAPINADGSLGSWQNTTPFNTGRLCFSSVVYNGYLYVIQGFYYSAAAPLTDVQFAAIHADGTLGPWQNTTSFAPGRWGHQSIAYNHYLYTMGGCNWNGSYYTLGDVHYSSIDANGTLNAWQGTTALDPYRDSFGLVQYGGNLIMTGGTNTSSGCYHYVQYAATNAGGTLGPWTRMTSFDKARVGHTSVVYNGYLYVIGGGDATGTVFADVQYAKINELSQPTHAVTFVESTGGTISGSLYQVITDGEDCAQITAASNTGYHFVNWTGTGGFVTTTDNPLTVTNVTADMTITANFAINTYTVTFAPDSHGTLTGVTPQVVNYGTSCTAVEAVPDTGYHFVNWTGTNGFVTTTDNPLTVSNVTADMTITANFAINTYTVTFVPDSNGTLTGVTPQTVNYGNSCTPVTAVPNPGYRLFNWTGTNGFVTTTGNPLTVTNVTADMTITANFLFTNLTGRVTDSGNNGIANLNVKVYDLNQTFMKSGTTDSNGDYVVPDLAAGSYKVFYDGASAGNYLSEWYNDKGAFGAADVLTLDIGHPLQGIDAQLTDGCIISGQVRNYAGTGLENVVVKLYDLNQEFIVSVSTDANGDYVFYCLPAGDYKLYADSGAVGNYISEWYRNTLSFDEAETLTVTAEMPREHIDVVLAAGGQIAGRITNQSGQGIQGVRVIIRDLQQTLIARVNSDGSGNYSITHLVPGFYKVFFDTGNAAGMVVKEWYNDKENFSTADIVVVPAEETTTVDVTLAAGGQVSGTITNGTDPIENMEVDIYGIDGLYIASGYTDGSGNYLVKGLPVGTYKVNFNPWELNYHGIDWYGLPRNYDYQYQWYNQKDGFVGADAVTVTVGNTATGIDAVMSETTGGIISGRITDSSGNGIAGSYACAFESFDNQLEWYYSEYYTGTGSDGNYEIKGLPTGNYIVLFFSQDTLYKREYYNNTRDRDLAARVSVIAGQTTAGIDAVLEKGGVITGRVTDSKGIGLENVVIRVMDAATDKYLGYIGNNAQTDDEGAYELTVHPGQWKVMFQTYMMNVGGYVSEFYNNRTAVENANIVTVAAEETTPNIDAVLSMGGGKISGYVKDPANTGLRNAQVYVYDTQYKVFVGQAAAESSGYFEVAGLIPGNYKVYTFYNDVYPAEWYSDQTAYETAKTLAVTTGGSTYIEVVLGGDDPEEPGTLRLTSPNGGESLTGGTVHPITWTAAGMNPGKKLIIEYTLNNGTKWIIITTGTVGAGSYNWTVPAVNSGACRVKIAVDEGDAGISDISDGPFGIVSAALPTIKLLSPKRWIEVTAGTTQNITWTGTGNIAQVAIEYSTNSGMTWSTITNSAPNTGSYQWAVPDTPSPHCRIRIRLEDGGSGSKPFDMTDYDFVILTTTIPGLTVTSPNGGEAWAVDSAQTITWVKTGTVPNVKIEYTVNNGSTWLVIAASTANTGSYPWTVPNNPSTQCKVRVSDLDGNPTDMSNAVFSIYVPLTLILTSPNGGEPWEAGTKQDITWTWSGGTGNVAIEYSTDSGTTWNPVATSATGGMYRWRVPDTSSENCLVRIKRNDTREGPTDVSDEVFTIEAAPLIAVEVPNGGEKWKAGETYPITWTSANLEGNVVIDLYRGDDFDYNIGAAAVSDGRWEWKIPGNFKNGTDYRVVIHKDQTEDASDTAFTITYKKPNPPDFDNDGKVDIIDRNRTTGRMEVWYMEGSRRKAVGNLPPAPMESGMSYRLVGTGDINRDGKVDILWQHSKNGQGLVWYMDGIMQKGTALLPPQPDKNWQVEGTGDFNGDGKTDILWRHALKGWVQVWLMEGVTVTGAIDLPAQEDLAWHVVGTGDFNGDEKTDILWRNEKDGRNEVWYMEGVVRTGTMAVQEQTKMQWQVVGTGDFNVDGHPDILWRRSTDGKYQVWYMDGVVRIGNEYINIPPNTTGSGTE